MYSTLTIAMKTQVWFLLELCQLYVRVVCSLSGPSVALSTGKYVGTSALTYNNISYLSFRGIKFAYVEQRFEEARPVKVSDSEFDATNFAPLCPQLDGTQVIGKEDCLYLNVYTPALDGSLPVIVYIHGGSFIADYPPRVKPDYFMEGSKIVMITISYRLGPLGFLYLDDEKYPANLGIRDQILALKWIKENVKQFGGNPDKVTIAGQSAGGASVSILTNSPAAKGLFVGAISESGTACTLWALQPRCTGIQRLRALTDKLNCSQYLKIGKGSSDEVVKCLRSVSTEDIVLAGNNLPLYLKTVPFPPILESSKVADPVILSYPGQDPANSTNIVSWITGVNSNEGVTLVPNMLPKSFLERTVFKILAPAYLPDLLMYKYTSSNPLLVTSKIFTKDIFLYLSNIEDFLIKVIGESSFAYPASQCLKRNISPTYSYYLNYVSSSQLGKQSGVGHGDDLSYIWPGSLEIREKGSKGDKEISEFLVSTWTNFAYYQNVSNPNVSWERYDFKKDNVLVIDNKGLRMETNPNRKTNDFYSALPLEDSPNTENC